MKKKLILLGLCTFMVCGCGKTIPTLSDGSQAVVSFSNGNSISINDFYNDLKNSFGLQALISLTDKQILEDKYKDNLTSANEYADSIMKSLEENYGDGLLTQHYLNKEKSTPLKAKIMFEEDMSLNKNYGKDFLEKFKEFALYEMALSLGMVSIYQKSNIPSDLLTLSYFSISLMFANYKLGIGRIISTESETLEFQIKKLIYAYKNNKISKEIFKKELYNLVNILNSHYKQDIGEKKLEKTR